MPLPTLKHLKNFMELKDGLRRLLGVALFGQPELHHLLSERNPEVREIVQRCEVLAMEPLGEDLGAYLAHKFARVGADMASVLTPDALHAIDKRLHYTPSGAKAGEGYSLCYPLVVNNLMVRAMNLATLWGQEQVSAQVIAEC